MHADYLMNVPPIVGMGMLDGFLVTGVILAVMRLPNALTSEDK